MMIFGAEAGWGTVDEVDVIVDDTVPPDQGLNSASLLPVTDAGNGTVLASSVQDNYYLWIVTWEEGVPFYTGSSSTPSGPRVLFAAGAGGGTAGDFNLTPDGQTILANLVAQLLSPPLSGPYAEFIAQFPALTGDDALPPADPDRDGTSCGRPNRRPTSTGGPCPVSNSWAEPPSASSFRREIPASDESPSPIPIDCQIGRRDDDVLMTASHAYSDERVLVVSRELFDSLGAFQGLTCDVERYLPHFLSPDRNFFMPRHAAEHDPSHKQIIPYAIFQHDGKYLHYVRGSKSGEQRLASKGSIGIGGHINASDHASASLEKDTYMTGVEREVNEELKMAGGFSQRIVALLNDDSNDVGKVHLGVVHLFDLESSDVTSNEAEITQLEFLSLAELQSRHQSLETWSQICLDGLTLLEGATLGSAPARRES